MSSVSLAALSAASFAAAGVLIVRVLLENAASARIGAGRSSSDQRVRQPSAPELGGRIDLNGVDEHALCSASASFNGGGGVKRILDVVFSLTLLGFLAPMLAVTAFAIKVDSRGPVLYRQKRVGRGGGIFEVYKFRSMICDAERDGPQFAAIGDRRITRVGHIIRRLRIDEIPQTINVLRGEMSFVGPRPERPEFVRDLREEIPHYEARHLVKPGITGWAQVKYEYAATVEGAREKLRYDLYYILRYTPLLDIAIVAMTIRVALFGLGSR
jgi:lipopolysaccharide/colanic/teichoic acid biosynthesis glycosyltransferase